MKIQFWYHSLHGAIFENQIHIGCLISNSKCFRPAVVNIWYNIHWKWSRFLKHMIVFALSFTNDIEISKKSSSLGVHLWIFESFITYYYRFQNFYYKFLKLNLFYYLKGCCILWIYKFWYDFVGRFKKIKQAYIWILGHFLHANILGMTLVFVNFALRQKIWAL